MYIQGEGHEFGEKVNVNNVEDKPGFYTCDEVSSTDECLIDNGCVIEPNCPDMDG